MNIFAAASSFSILRPIAMLFGQVMDFLFRCTSHFGIYSLGISIILFTIITKLILFPLTVKQQESSKMMSLMNPEIQAIQKKYKNKTDQASMMRQQEEIKAVYAKYGSSPTAGCLPLIIQLPIIFALYRVVYDIPAYVPSVRGYFQTVAEPLMAQSDFASKIGDLVGTVKISNFDASSADSVVAFLYKLTAGGWDTLKGLFPAVFSTDTVNSAVSTIAQMNTFLGINLASAPWQGFTHINLAWLLPILAGLTQYLSTKLMSSSQPVDPDQPGAQMMNQMTITMPLISVFFCFTLPCAIGIYWVMQGFVTLIQQIIVNKHMEKIDVNKLIEKNVAKMNRKRAKQGLPPAKISDNANGSMKIIRDKQNAEIKEEQEHSLRQAATKKIVKDSTEYYNDDPKPGSLASKANMVKKYNERHNEK
ncbi:YidC/Oxa1 family membrane protein insertase [Clostridium vitabionis]|uniref:YidC/Oxa1 family membrane protein insertase n=1 Tax=Clostridium vitabionis TaxID=2784388 RepID=UPI0038B3702C